MDYTGLSHQFTFNADNLGFTFFVQILNDDSVESTEQLASTVTTDIAQFPGVVLDPHQAVVNILDNDGSATLYYCLSLM